jgi:hypothetical protein
MERSGIDIIFKSAKRKYPFLVDWDFNLNESYATITPIILRVNQDKVCKYYGYKKIKRFAKGFGNFSWVMICEEIRDFFETGYTMIPIEHCIPNELFTEGVPKQLSVGLLYFS